MWPWVGCKHSVYALPERGGSGNAYADGEPMVRMSGPDGVIRPIPQSKVGEAIADGGSRVK